MPSAATGQAMISAGTTKNLTAARLGVASSLLPSYRLCANDRPERKVPPR
jgi:hypothetical protein